MKRVTVYLEEEIYRLLKAKLALSGDNFSNWLRKIVKRYMVGENG